MDEIWPSIVVSLVTALATGIVTSFLYWRKAKAELHKEYESRFNKQKWEVYSKFVRTMGRISSGINIDRKPDYTEIGPEYREVISRLLLVASDGVIEAFNAYWKFFSKSQLQLRMMSDEEFRNRTVEQWNEYSATLERTKVAIVLEMRKDLGYKTKVSSDDVSTTLEALMCPPPDF